MELIDKSSPPGPAVSKRLFRLLRSLYFLLRGALSKHKLLLAELKLRLLLERGRTAGRTIGRALSHRCADHATSFYNPRDVVEFSCSNTPTSSYAARRRDRHHQQQYYSAKVVETAFEVLDYEDSDADDGGLGSAAPSPRPPPHKSPVAAGGHVDKEAEDFIRRFYEQLRSQQRMVTPESGFGR